MTLVLATFKGLTSCSKLKNSAKNHNNGLVTYFWASLCVDVLEYMLKSQNYQLIVQSEICFRIVDIKQNIWVAPGVWFLIY